MLSIATDVFKTEESSAEAFTIDIERLFIASRALINDGSTAEVFVIDCVRLFIASRVFEINGSRAEGFAIDRARLSIASPVLERDGSKAAALAIDRVTLDIAARIAGGSARALIACERLSNCRVRLPAATKFSRLAEFATEASFAWCESDLNVVFAVLNAWAGICCLRA
jgi:hypothetical protein